MPENAWEREHHRKGKCLATYGTNLPCQLDANHESEMHTNHNCAQDWYDRERHETGLTHEEGVAALAEIQRETLGGVAATEARQERPMAEPVVWMLKNTLLALREGRMESGTVWPTEGAVPWESGEGQPLYTHPPGATEELREALEKAVTWFEAPAKIRHNIIGQPPNKWREVWLHYSPEEVAHVDGLRAALAATQEEADDPNS